MYFSHQYPSLSDDVEIVYQSCLPTYCSVRGDGVRVVLPPPQHHQVDPVEGRRGPAGVYLHSLWQDATLQRATLQCQLPAVAGSQGNQPRDEDQGQEFLLPP